MSEKTTPDPTCRKCPFNHLEKGYCKIHGRKYGLGESMCIEAVEEKVRLGNVVIEKAKKDKDIARESQAVSQIIPYQKYLAKLTNEKLKIIELESIEYKEALLQDISKAKYYKKHVKVKGLLMGKDYTPFLIPKKIKAFCDSTKQNKKCMLCPLADGEEIFEIDYLKNRDIVLEMIDINNNQLLGVIRKKIGLPTCSMSNINITEQQNVEELRIIPELKADMIDYKYTIKRGLFMGEGLHTNLQYELKGTTLPDAKNQLATFLVNSADNSENDIDNFKLTEKMKRRLKIFQVKPGHTISEKLKEIYTDFTYNVDPQIYGRKNLHLAVDLVYHSVLNFNFMDGPIDRGWAEVLIIGDTRCGKTQLVKKMVRHYRAGEFVTSGENTTFAGLIAGVHQTGKHWVVEWGKWILNNRRILIIDEADGIEQDIIGKLSGLRSSGIVDVVKIRKEKTMAKTRVIWITNPMKGNLNRYSYGIQSVKEIFKRQQDISRLDFVVGVAKTDVPIDIINKRHKNPVPDHKFTSELCHALVMFAWSRGPESVTFKKSAEDFILNKSIEFDKKYSYNIPIVTGAEMRNKIAKLSAALAARLFSVDDHCENIIVKEEHAKFIVNFLEQEYARKSLDYTGYSEQKNTENNLKSNADMENLIEWNMDRITLFLNLGRFTLGDIQDVLSLSGKAEVKTILSSLVRLRAMLKINTYYAKTPAFIEWLKNKKDLLLRGTDKDEMLF